MTHRGDVEDAERKKRGGSPRKTRKGREKDKERAEDGAAEAAKVAKAKRGNGTREWGQGNEEKTPGKRSIGKMIGQAGSGFGLFHPHHLAWTLPPFPLWLAFPGPHSAATFLP